MLLNKLNIILPALITVTAISGTSYLLPDEDAVLFFNYCSTGCNYIRAIYSNDVFYLPLSELFSLLCIYYEVDRSKMVIEGKWYDPDIDWKLDFNSHEAQTGKVSFLFSVDDYRLDMTDIYISSNLFERAFNLRFKINLSTLNLSLEYDGELPVDKQKERKRRYLKIEAGEEKKDNFRLIYPHKRQLFKTGVLDYNVGVVTGSGSSLFNYLFKGGAELLGGAFSGGVSGTHTGNLNSIKVVDASWEYLFNDNPVITTFRAGQLYSNGVFQRRITGVAFSNEPVIPRRYCNYHLTEGTSSPGSDVELYLNGRLYAYGSTGENGYYRFEYPLSYGSVRSKVQIYKPDGEVVIRESRITTPEDFLPEGAITYDIKGGFSDNGSFDFRGRNFFYQGYVAGGFTKNITVRAGAAYPGGEAGIQYYTTALARIRESYLVKIFVAPGVIYKTGAEAYYHKGHSWQITYSDFRSEQLSNIRMPESEFYAGAFFPCTLHELKTGFRFSFRHNRYSDGTGSDLSGGVSARLKRLVFRVDYRNRLNSSNISANYTAGFLSSSLAFSFSNMQHLPSIVRGMMLNAKGVYECCYGRIGSAGLRVSKTLFGRGRSFIDFNYKPSTETLFLQAGMNIDLNCFRVSSGFLKVKDHLSYRQNVIGSVSSVSEKGKVLFSGREQVGYGGVSLLMFVDSNGNGKYDKGEIKVPSAALKFSRAVDKKMSSEGVLHLGRLTAYQVYNVEIIRSELPDPLLTPVNDKFSFIAGPNSYRLIEIPLYRTGVIEGKVVFQNDLKRQPAGRLKVIMEAVESKIKKVIYTFSDGTFYSMDIPPGRYRIKIDPCQLDYLNLKSSPAKREVEVKAAAEGDFIKDITFIVIRKI